MLAPNVKLISVLRYHATNFLDLVFFNQLPINKNVSILGETWKLKKKILPSNEADFVHSPESFFQRNSFFNMYLQL